MGKISHDAPMDTISFFLEVNSTCYFASRLANQSMQKVLFTCVVHTNYWYC